MWWRRLREKLAEWWHFATPAEWLGGSYFPSPPADPALAPPPPFAGVAQAVEERRAVDAEVGGSSPPPGATLDHDCPLQDGTLPEMPPPEEPAQPKPRTPQATLDLIEAGHEHCPGCGHHFDPRIRQRMKYRKFAKMRRAVADSINEVLNRLAALDLKSGGKYSATREQKVLENLMGCDFYFLDSMNTVGQSHPFFDELAKNEENNPLAPGSRFVTMAPHPEINDDLAEISWPIDTAVVVRKDGYWFFERLKTATPAEARGRCQYFPPRMAHHSYLSINDDGTWFAEDAFVGLLNGKWSLLDGNLKSERYLKRGLSLEVSTYHSQHLRDQINKTVSIMVSIQFTRRYSWHVALGHRPDGPRMLLATNPVGCLQFFKNRDKAQNRARREALRHWVTRHYRDREDSGVAYVRDHLRGATEFNWSDLECEIFVSQFDLEKNEAFKQEADLWRAQRKHNTVKVRLKRRAT